MAKLFIPQVGDSLKLISNWDCKVFNEYGNIKVFSGLGIDTTQNKNMNVDVTFPKGTVLRVERLYVRAPASSFDSLTVRVLECPIKGLIKARFWVKLMDANNIEFEEVKTSLASYKKLKDCVRFVALSEGMKNSETLGDDEAIFVGQKLYEYFKPENAIKIKFEISPEVAFKTINFEQIANKYGKKINPTTGELEFLWKNIKNEFNKIELTLNLIPVLDGFVYVYEKNNEVIKMDKLVGTFEQYNQEEYTGITTKRGSYLSWDWYSVQMAKDWRPDFLDNQMYRTNLIDGQEDLQDVKFEYKGNKIKIANQDDFDKLIKKVRKENNTIFGVK